MKMQTLTVDETTTWLNTVEEARQSLIVLTNMYNGLTKKMYDMYMDKYTGSKFRFLYERYDTLEEFMDSEQQVYANIGTTPPGFLGFGSMSKPRYSQEALEFMSVYKKLYYEMDELVSKLSVRWSVHAMKPFQIESHDVEDFILVSRYANILRNACKQYAAVRKAILTNDDSSEQLHTLIIGRTIRELSK